MLAGYQYIDPHKSRMNTDCPQQQHEVMIVRDPQQLNLNGAHQPIQSIPAQIQSIRAVVGQETNASPTRSNQAEPPRPKQRYTQMAMDQLPWQQHTLPILSNQQSTSTHSSRHKNHAIMTAACTQQYQPRPQQLQSSGQHDFSNFANQYSSGGSLESQNILYKSAQQNEPSQETQTYQLLSTSTAILQDGQQTHQQWTQQTNQRQPTQQTGPIQSIHHHQPSLRVEMHDFAQLHPQNNTQRK